LSAVWADGDEVSLFRSKQLTKILLYTLRKFSKEKTMDKKTIGIIATIATGLLCGCPGLFGLCLGLTSVAASFIPSAEIDIFGSNDPASATVAGFVALCLSLIFIAIPIVVGVETLRNKPQLPVDNEPLPPAS